MGVSESERYAGEVREVSFFCSFVRGGGCVCSSGGNAGVEANGMCSIIQGRWRIRVEIDGR